MAINYNNYNNINTNVRIYKVKEFILFYSVSILWLIIPWLIKKIILKQFFVPVRYTPNKKEQEILSQGTNFKIFVDQQRIQCWKWGSGPAVIFSHGWNGSGIQFQSFIKHLTDSGYSAILFDGPGHGLSDGEISSYFQMTNTIRALMRYCTSNETGLCGIVGHSFGAAAIVNAINKENEQIPIVLIAPALYLKQILEKTFQKYGIPLYIFRSVIRDFEVKYGYSLVSDNPVDLLTNHQIPALIIHDEEDKVIPCQISKRFSTKSKLIKLLITRGLGHLRILKDRGVIESVIGYLKQNN